MKLTRQEVLNLRDGILATHQTGVVSEHNFGYALAHTRHGITGEVKAIEAALESFEKRRLTLCEEYSEYGDDEKPLKHEDGRFKIIADKREEFDAAVKELFEEREAWLAEVVTVNVVKVVGAVPNMLTVISDNLRPILPKPKDVEEE